MKAIDKIRSFLKKNEYDGILLERRDNYAWVGEGAQNHVLSGTEIGIAYYVIRQDDIELIADSSDAPRMSKEQNPLQAKITEVPWYESVEGYISHMIQGKCYVSDTGIAGTKNVQGDLVQLRLMLSEKELERYREIGRLGAKIVEEVCRGAAPGQTENEIAYKLKSACINRGISPDCVLVGADERILHYRHPMPTDKKIEKSLMVVLGGEKYGLNISMTRMIYFEEIPKKIKERYSKTQYIFACMQKMMQDGMSYPEYFAKVEGLYAEVGYAEEWKLHHQGGPTGYGCREVVLGPGETRPEQKEMIIRTGHAYAWNPTIQGTKCEETTYLGMKDIETFTKTGEWPYRVVKTPYGEFEVADILVL